MLYNGNCLDVMDDLIASGVKVDCIVTKPEHTILDPFMSSGTTGIVSKQLNRKFIGIELGTDMYNIAKDRIDNVSDLW